LWSVCGGEGGGGGGREGGGGVRDLEPPTGLRVLKGPLVVLQLLLWEELSLQAKQRSAPPPKPRGPTKRGVCASLPAALLPVDATHVAAVPSTPAAISAKPPAVARKFFRLFWIKGDMHCSVPAGQLPSVRAVKPPPGADSKPLHAARRSIVHTSRRSAVAPKSSRTVP
jgi:hypothetical protein